MIRVPGLEGSVAPLPLDRGPRRTRTSAPLYSARAVLSYVGVAVGQVSREVTYLIGGGAVDMLQSPRDAALTLKAAIALGVKKSQIFEEYVLTCAAADMAGSSAPTPTAPPPPVFVSPHAPRPCPSSTATATPRPQDVAASAVATDLVDDKFPNARMDKIYDYLLTSVAPSHQRGAWINGMAMLLSKDPGLMASMVMSPWGADALKATRKAVFELYEQELRMMNGVIRSMVTSTAGNG